LAAGVIAPCSPIVFGRGPRLPVPCPIASAMRRSCQTGRNDACR